MTAGPDPMPGDLVRGTLDTDRHQGKMSIRDNGGRDVTDAGTSLGTLRTASKCQLRRRGEGGFFPRVLR